MGVGPGLGELRGLSPTASLSVVSLGDVDFGPLLAAFEDVMSIFVTLSLPNTRPANSARRVVLHK
jgi:hypothetical protein